MLPVEKDSSMSIQYLKNAQSNLPSKRVLEDGFLGTYSAPNAGIQCCAKVSKTAYQLEVPHQHDFLTGWIDAPVTINDPTPIMGLKRGSQFREKAV